MRARYVISVAAGIALLGAGIAGATLTGSSLLSAGPPETIPPEEAQIPESLPEQALAGMAQAEAKRTLAMTFVDAMRAWTVCVAEQAPLHDESTGEFDPEAACGPKPTPTLPENGEDGDEGGAGAGRGDQASAFAKQTADEAQTGGEDFGKQTADEAQTGGEAFGQQTAGEAQPDFAGPPGP
jgi:hypothetical protein